MTKLTFSALAFVLMASATAQEAQACGQRTFPKIECRPGRSGGGVAARLCTNRRNGLAWEWLLITGAEARQLCGDAVAPAQTSAAPASLSANELQEARRNGEAARGTANHRGVSFQDLLQQRRARVVGSTPDGQPVYEYQSVGRSVRLY